MNLQPQPGTPESGSFRRPLFDDPSARALSRVGVVDVGSNSVRMVVFDGAARSPAYFYNEKIMCALGDGLAETGRLNPQGRVRALAALNRFQHVARGLGLAPLTAVATAAVREAGDGQDFCDQIERETGLPVWIIDGQEEARLSAQGVLLGWPGAYGLVCDMGGASMELAEIDGNRVGNCMTASLGPLKLTHVTGGRRGRKALIKATVEDMRAKMGKQRDRMFLVGGSWRAIARIDMARRNYPMTVLHEYRMTAASVRETLRFIETTDLEKLGARAMVSQARMALVPIAIDVLHRLVRTFRPHDIALSSYGIREGMLYEQMPQRLRDRDPLIEACWYAESRDARLPGFGRTLFNFVMPLFKSVPATRVRLIKAACLLHDVSWRAHPDYRADACFDYATRSNMGGMKHSERVYLGLALQHRYRNKRPTDRFGAYYRLLDDKSQKQAEILGKAMRFGAMLWMHKDAPIGQLRWHPRKKLLDLGLPPEARPLYGEVARARLMSLARALESEVRVTLPGQPGV